MASGDSSESGFVSEFGGMIGEGLIIGDFSGGGGIDSL
jgi:hypothetical protein